LEEGERLLARLDSGDEPDARQNQLLDWAGSGAVAPPHDVAQRLAEHRGEMPPAGQSSAAAGPSGHGPVSRRQLLDVLQRLNRVTTGQLLELGADAERVNQRIQDGDIELEMGMARRFAEFGVVRRPDAEEPRVPRAGRATASGRGGLSAEDSDEHLTGSDSDHSEFDARMDVDSDHSATSDSGRRSERSEEDEPSVKGKGKQRAGAALKRSRIVLSESESLDGEHGGGSEEDEPSV